MAVHTIDKCPDRQTCEYHRQVPPPDLPEEARPHVIAYLRWLANDRGSHGGLFCRWDSNELDDIADQLETDGTSDVPSTDDTTEDPLMICRVCKHVLNVLVPADGGEHEYVHGEQDITGHDPQPIPPPPDYRGRCDFCNFAQPEFVVPVRNFEVEMCPGHMGGTDWSACAICANLIDRNQWPGLVARVAALRERRDDRLLPPEVRAGIAGLYRQVRRNITGSIRPIAEDVDNDEYR